MDLFDFDIRKNTNKPLAERMRISQIEDFIGQKHIVGNGKLLNRAIKADRLGSCIFYGPPGTGKTTLANVIANSTGAIYKKLNAVSSGVADAKKIIAEAKDAQRLYNKKTYLYLDECHRWSKAQSDSILEAMEKGYIIFIGSTTENPYVSMTNAIISRCRVFEFEKLTFEDILGALKFALLDIENGLGNYNTKVDEKALNHIAMFADGDLRIAYNALELAVLTTNPNEDNVIHITVEVAEESIQTKALSVDKDMYYDMLSAFCKSLRGSDSDGALYWSQRLIVAGIDPLIIARRLVVHSSEDVGMADPNALNIATSAMLAYERIGKPEGLIPLSNAIVYVCEASKSPSVYNAMHMARDAALNTKDDIIPSYLKDQHYKKNKDTSYKYPHNYGGWVEQQYLPDKLKDKVFYQPSENGFEKDLIRAKIIKKNKG